MTESRTGDDPSTFVSDCRRCGEAVLVDLSQPLPSHYPFCTERCKMIDLGKWFSEEFKVSRPVEEADLEQLD
jgi:endogenous inhibitor of DNA gyrase (YacG/DUF329 family)